MYPVCSVIAAASLSECACLGADATTYIIAFNNRGHGATAPLPK